MVELVAENGHERLNVRELVRRAGVSTRAFYEHFGSKEDCLRRTYEMLTRRATRRIVAAQAGQSDWRQRLRLVFGEFAREAARDPVGARFALLEPYDSGEPALLAQAWRAERIFEGMLIECLARAPSGVAVPPMIVEAMVAGISSVARGRLRSGRVNDFVESTDALVDWAISYVDRAAMELADLDRGLVWRDTTLESPAPPSSGADGGSWSSTGDRALLLSAVAELVAANGYAKVTVSRVRSVAGVSRAKFDAHFDGLEDCFLAALEQRAGDALAQAERARTVAGGRPGSVYRAVSALCDQVGRDAFLSRVCLIDDFPASPDGARLRRYLIVSVTDLLSEHTSLGDARSKERQSRVSREAVMGAVWAMFHHYVVRERSLRRQVSATLSYLILAPAAGAPDAVAAIRSEQRA